MKKALIIGVTGQDGAYLASLLTRNGYMVYGASRHSASRNLWRLDSLGMTANGESIIDNLELISLDVACSVSVTNTIQVGYYDEVYNLAAMSFVPESFASPVSTFNINAIGVLNLLEAIRLNSPHTRFYQASTSEMFGLVNVDAQNEDTPFHPRSPYAVAKAAAHYAVQNYREAYGLHASCGILFNHESPLRGEEFVTRKITKGVARITAEGQDKLALGNMDAKRDWGYALDYVNGMHLMLQQREPDDYVLATGETHTVREAVDIAFDRVHMKADDYIEQDERYMRPSDVPLLCGDASKAKRVLGWEPSVGFTDLINMMVDHDLMNEGIDPIEFQINLEQFREA